MPLGSDADDKDCNNVEWNCASIVGMLLCVSNDTQPDITHAVNQVARFTAKPKMSHVKAMKTIVRHLKKDTNKGILLSNLTELTMWNVGWMQTLQGALDLNLTTIQSHASPDADASSLAEAYLWFRNLSWSKKSVLALHMQNTPVCLRHYELWFPFAVWYLILFCKPN